MIWTSVGHDYSPPSSPLREVDIMHETILLIEERQQPETVQILPVDRTEDPRNVRNVLPLVTPDANDVQVQQPAPRPHLERSRRRHRGRLAHLARPARLLHRARPPVPGVAAAGPQGPAPAARRRRAAVRRAQPVRAAAARGGRRGQEVPAPGARRRRRDRRPVGLGRAGAAGRRRRRRSRFARPEAAAAASARSRRRWRSSRRPRARATASATCHGDAPPSIARAA